MEWSGVEWDASSVSGESQMVRRQAPPGYHVLKVFPNALECIEVKKMKDEMHPGVVPLT
jgi:hypothetical protein